MTPKKSRKLDPLPTLAAMNSENCALRARQLRFCGISEPYLHPLRVQTFPFSQRILFREVSLQGVALSAYGLEA